MSEGDERKALITTEYLDLKKDATTLKDKIATVQREIDEYRQALGNHVKGLKRLGDEVREFYGQQLPLLQKQLDALQQERHDIQERLKPIEQAILQASSGK